MANAKQQGEYKILVIEDEKTLMNLIVNKLAKDGFVVQQAHDGQEGYEMIVSQQPDLILLDIVMPRLNGYEVLEKMKANKISIPVIIISNSGQPVEIEKAQAMGAVDHLVKTEFEPGEVLKKVKKFLGIISANEPADDLVYKPREDADAKPLGIKILLVEDDPFLREICGKKLAKEGYAVYEAIDGLLALEIVKKVLPQIVLLDVILPNMDGFDVLKKIRADEQKEVATVPIIMLSNLGQEDDIKRAMAAGANDYLVKAHFTTDEIADRVKTVLKK
jgi:DNA-binding response OmpR family regulator